MASLRHFIMRAEARALYREVLRSVRGLDASTAAGVRQAARERFAENACETDLKRVQPAPRGPRRRPVTTLHLRAIAQAFARCSLMARPISKRCVRASAPSAARMPLARRTRPQPVTNRALDMTTATLLEVVPWVHV